MTTTDTHSARTVVLALGLLAASLLSFRLFWAGDVGELFLVLLAIGFTGLVTLTPRLRARRARIAVYLAVGIIATMSAALFGWGMVLGS